MKIDRNDPIIQMIIQAIVGQVGMLKAVKILNEADAIMEQLEEIEDERV